MKQSALSFNQWLGHVANQVKLTHFLAQY